MTDWYYAEGGDPNGPHSDEDIRSLLLVGQLDTDSLVWRDGMTSWAKIIDLDEFQDVRLKKSPPPIPVARPPIPEVPSTWAPVSEEQAADPDERPKGWGEPIFVPAAERSALNRNSPWSRYFARALDLTITSYIAGFGVGYGLVYLAPDLYRAFVGQHSSFQNVILLPVAMILNGIVTGVFGTTLGKSVMALRFTYLNGNLGLLGQVGREMKVWVQGLGLGIPIVSIFSGAFQYRRVIKGLPASYDEGIVLVKQDDIPAWRRAVGMLFCAAVFVGGIAWSLWPEPAASYSPPAAVSNVSVQWTNSISGQSATLPPGWTASAQDNGEGATVYVFNSADGTKQAIFGVEDAVAELAADVQEYGLALKAGFAGTMTLGDFGPTTTPGVLRADGTFDSEGWRTSALIRQVGNRFWRIVIVDSVARSGDVTVPALTSALWSTTN